MNIDKVKSIIVVVLLLIFFWAGQETNSPQTTLWTLTKDLISTLCSMATLFIAILALNNWKAQAKNSKIDQVVESLPSLEKSQQACSHSVLAMHMYFGEGAKDWEKHANLYQERQSKLVNEIIEHKAKLNILRRYLDNNNYQSLIRLFSDYETNINITNDYLKYTYPDAFFREDSVFTKISGLSAQGLRSSSERLYNKYTDYICGIT